MIRISTQYYALQFKTPAGTSRGVLKTKPSWFITITDTENPDKVGFGECSIIPGLSFDDGPDFMTGFDRIPKEFRDLNDLLSFNHSSLDDFPAIRFGLEVAVTDFTSPNEGILYESNFTRGSSSIPINGLIWMGDKQKMFDQVKAKLEAGWSCIKLKIGAINFDDELLLIKHIRSAFSKDDVVIRVDANGAFSPTDAIRYLDQLASLDVHSIEQPISAGKPQEMARLCEESPIPVALDEELIGINMTAKKKALISLIKPHYIIIKPSLTGGFKKSEEWIAIAQSLGTDFWITSALESNIGLNAIAQWTAQRAFKGYQGLGTGQLFTNNIDSPLKISPGYLSYDPADSWDFKKLYKR
jgi:o-succinylbenzoate synthase